MEYREIRVGEWDEAMELWVRVFGPVGWIFQSLHESTADRSPEHTRVAVVDGRIVSAVDVFVRPMRGTDGTPLKVGGIGSVATYDENRRQGHSGQLLLDAIEVMEREGCAWSFLFTGTHRHYEKYGWFTLPLTSRYGTFREEFSPAASRYRVEELSPSNWRLAELASVYDSFNADRPLSHVRSEVYWSNAIRVRLERPDRQTWAAMDGDELVGYASASWNDDKGNLDEACCLPGYEGALAPLVGAFYSSAKARGIANVDFLFSMNPVLYPHFEAVAEDLRLELRRHTMVRPLKGGLSEDDLRTLFAAPGRMHYELDNF